MEKQAEVFTESEMEIRNIVYSILEIYRSITQKITGDYPGSEISIKINGIQSFTDYNFYEHRIEIEGVRFNIHLAGSRVIILTDDCIKGLWPKIKIEILKA